MCGQVADPYKIRGNKIVRISRENDIHPYRIVLICNIDCLPIADIYSCTLQFIALLRPLFYYPFCLSAGHSQNTFSKFLNQTTRKYDMFRKMRRTERELPERQAKEILENGSYGVLALAGDGGYPYAVPLNYVYDGERIYFHCAAEGHKIDAIARDNKCSFCVVENGGVIEDRFTTKYRSAIAFGKIYEETDEKCRENAFRLMMRSLTPSVTNEKREEMSHCQKARILAMDIEYLSGKGANQ